MSTVVVDLKDAYNRVQFKLLMKLLRQYGVSLTLTRWLAAALQERKVAMRLGNWISTPQQLTMGLPQGSPAVPCPLQCLHKGTGGSEQQWFKPGAYTWGRRAYLQNSSTAVTAVQEQLEKVSHWCQETVRNQPKQGASPVVHPQQQSSRTSNASSLLQWRSHRNARTVSRYLGIHFDRMLTYKTQVGSTKLRCKKRLSALKAMASKGIEQRHLFLLYQSVILSVIGYGLGLTTLSQSNLLKLDRVQNEAMRVILGTTKDTPTESMRYLLDLPSMETRHKVEQVNAYLNAMQNPKNPLHDAVKEEKGS